MESQSARLVASEAPRREPSWLDKQLLRELDNGWRKAYLCYALALMLILGTALMVTL